MASSGRRISQILLVAFIFLFAGSLIPAALAVPAFEAPSWASGFNHASYERGAILDPNNYVLFWGVNSDTKEIKFAAVVKTMGWVGLGISSNGGMRGADIALLTKDASGKLIIQDRWANDTVQPYLDGIQNKRLIESETKQENGVTAFVFTRRWGACDNEDFPIEAGAVWVIRAFGDNHNFEYHGPSNRAAIRLNLLSPPEVLQAETETLEVDIVQPPYSLTSDKTQYVCSSHILPRDRKYHVTVARPIVGLSQVHHMILFKCVGAVNQSTTATRCSSMTGSCIVFWTGWAVGGQDMVFPPDAGLPMGPDPADPNGGSMYMLLQIHYDNPAGVAGTVDQRSGFKLVYTPTLRKYDVGVLTLGEVDFVVPANTASYSVLNECPESCTTRFPSSGITVIGNGFHMHELGKSARLQHIRNGKELPPIGEQKYYDFEHQNVDPTAQLTRVMPGDRLLLTCSWSSRGRNTPTTFGEDTSKEMCFNFLAYYPKMATFACFSLGSLFSVLAGGGGRAVAVCAPELDLGYTNLNSQQLLQIVNSTKALFDRGAGYTPVEETEGDCARTLPYCGNSNLDNGEDCESGDGCSACKCMQGWFPNRNTQTCSNSPDFLSTPTGVATVASFAVAGLFLILLVILVAVILVTKRSDKKREALRAARRKRDPRKDREIRVEDDSESEYEDEGDESSSAKVKLAPRGSKGKKSPAAKRGASSGEEDKEESTDTGSVNEDADSIESSSHAKHKKPNKKKKQVSSSSSSSTASSSADDEDSSSVQAEDGDDEDSDEGSDEVSEGDSDSSSAKQSSSSSSSDSEESS